MSAELMKQEQSEITVAQSPVMWAMANSVPPEQMLAYYQLDREMKADAARNAFNEAFAKFKAEAVTILKATKVAAGPLSGTMYANLYDVVAAVIPALAKHGLSHSWKLSRDEPLWMEVTCFIRHAQGHSESVSMGAAPDTGPGRNAIQARGSAKTYLERYTLLAATGMAAGGTDDDGHATGAPEKPTAPAMDDNALIDYRDAIQGAGDEDELKRFYGAAYREAKRLGDKHAEAEFVAAKEAAKKRLGL